MPALDFRKLEILKDMGVDVWRLKKTDSRDTDNLNQNIGTGAPLFSEVVESAQIADPPHSVAKVSVQASVDIAPVQGLTLEAVAGEIRNCKNCGLHLQRNNTVPGEGSIHADWMFIGEAPGSNEDQEGLPFVGKAGQLLNAMIKALGMERSDVFIANVVKCRPPDNRDPSEDEVTQCAPFLHQQLKLIQPSVIIALGRVSAQQLLQTSDSMASMRRKKHFYGESQTPLIATYHPAYLLRRPEEKYKAWEDLLMARSIVSQLID